MRGLIAEYGLGVVGAYMHHIRANAEAAVREMLREFSLSQVSQCDVGFQNTDVRFLVHFQR